MTFKERTSEFNSLIQNVKQRKEGLTGSVGVRNKSRKPNEKSQFFIVASQVGKDIAETAEKLERLSKLAKKKSLFDDPAIEISELTQIINQDIKNLTNQLNSLHTTANSSRRNKHQQKHTETVVDALKQKLRGTTQDFSEILGIRTENLKSQQKEKENFTGSMSPSFGKRAVESPLYRAAQSSQNSYDSSSSGEVVIHMPQQQSQLMIPNRSYLQSRGEAVTNIERTITELQGIFSQLATLVQEQGELINRIDHDIDETSINTNRAQNELLKYLSSVSSNRWLIVKIFLVAIFFSVLFIIFFV